MNVTQRLWTTKFSNNAFEAINVFTTAFLEVELSEQVVEKRQIAISLESKAE